MYKIKIRMLMAENKIDTIKDLCRITKISRNFVLKLLREEQLDTMKTGNLVKLCDYFNCSLSDLIEYTPDEK